MTLAILVLAARTAPGQVAYLSQLSTEEIDELDRETTVVIIPTGVLEEHGPHLPVFTDGYVAEWVTRELGNAIVSQRGWRAVIFPTIPIGVGEPEEFAPRNRFPGSYAVRPSTQRAVFMDIATGLGETGFKWVFVMAFHGPLVQSRTIDQAGEYFEDIYGGTMVHLRGLVHPNPPARAKPLSEEEAAEDGRAVHAGLVETSRMLFVRPDLVKPSFRQLESLTPNEWDDLHRIAQEDSWPGYYGAPKLARADIGADELRATATNVIDLALKILDGLDYKQISHRADFRNPVFRKLDEEILAHERRVAEQQERWLASKGIR